MQQRAVDAHDACGAKEHRVRIDACGAKEHRVRIDACGANI
jgi:hypothetical protein